jgi:hypothetical protein
MEEREKNTEKIGGHNERREGRETERRRRKHREREK